MKNTTRSINFTVALFTGLSVFYFIITRFQIEDYFENAEIALITAIMVSITLVFPMVQAIMRYFEIKPYYVPERLFFKAPLGEHFIQQRALYYVILGLAYFFIYLKSGQRIPNEAFIWSFIWVVIFELTLLFTRMLTKVYIMGDGIIVMGFDMRMDIPLSDPLISHSGVYTYDDFTHFELKGSRLVLYMPHKSGSVRFSIPKDKVPHLTSFLVSKGIEPV